MRLCNIPVNDFGGHRVLFSNEYAGRGDLFEGLSIWTEEKYRQMQGTFPVIFLTFAGVKASGYADMEYCITKVIADSQMLMPKSRKNSMRQSLFQRALRWSRYENMGLPFRERSA